MTTRTATELWAPRSEIEQVQRIGSALRSHWSAAKQIAATSPFFRRSANWLDTSRRHLAPHHFTIGGKLIK